MAAGAFMGWTLGALFEVPSVTYALWFSFLAGGIFGLAVNVEMRILDSAEQLRYFVAGSAVLVTLMMLLERFGKLAEL